jgi:hypothetical protein
MLSLPHAAAIRAALNQPLSPKLHSILTDELAIAEANGLENLTHVLVVQPGDEVDSVEQELGWSPLQDMGGVRFGDPEFQPPWDWQQELDGFFRLIRTVGNEGFDLILVVEDAPGVAPELLRMCRSVGAGEE